MCVFEPAGAFENDEIETDIVAYLGYGFASCNM
jgi:hypothetical protein